MEINYIALSIPVFFILIVIEILLARWQEKKYYRFNDAITDLSCGIGQQVTGVFMKTGLYAGYVYLYNHYALFTFSTSSITAWVLAFFGVDICYYWWHRLSHEVNFMWAIHVVHHQSEDYNLAVALRQAWFSSITIWVFYASLAFLGIPPVVFLTMSSFSTLYQFWIHTRTVGKLGLLESTINTPSHHRVHHGRNLKYLDKNYGATLIIWDRLFGSFQKEEEEPLYGTVKPYTSWNPIWTNFYYWVEMAKEAWRAPYFVDKLKVWFMYPGWHPRGLDKYASSPEADSDAPIRFDTKAPRGLNRYIAVHFVLVILATTALLFMGKKSSLSELACLSVIILLTILIWGGLFEKKSWALPLELVRLVVVAAITVAYFWGDRTMLPVVTATLVGLIIFAAWILRYLRFFIANREEAVSAS